MVADAFSNPSGGELSASGDPPSEPNGPTLTRAPPGPGVPGPGLGSPDERASGALPASELASKPSVSSQPPSLSYACATPSPPSAAAAAHAAQAAPSPDGPAGMAATNNIAAFDGSPFKRARSCASPLHAFPGTAQAAASSGCLNSSSLDGQSSSATAPACHSGLASGPPSPSRLARTSSAVSPPAPPAVIPAPASPSRAGVEGVSAPPLWASPSTSTPHAGGLISPVASSPAPPLPPSPGVPVLLEASKPRDSRRELPMACQVLGCGLDLHGQADYYQRYRVCKAHLKASVLHVEGESQRFCQQCGRFHPLAEFDGTKRNCRARLEQHNSRRRKVAHNAAPALRSRRGPSRGDSAAETLPSRRGREEGAAGEATEADRAPIGALPRESSACSPDAVELLRLRSAAPGPRAAARGEPLFRDVPRFALPAGRGGWGLSPRAARPSLEVGTRAGGASGLPAPRESAREALARLLALPREVLRSLASEAGEVDGEQGPELQRLLLHVARLSQGLEVEEQQASGVLGGLASGEAGGQALGRAYPDVGHSGNAYPEPRRSGSAYPEPRASGSFQRLPGCFGAGLEEGGGGPGSVPLAATRVSPLSSLGSLPFSLSSVPSALASTLLTAHSRHEGSSGSLAHAPQGCPSAELGLSRLDYGGPPALSSRPDRSLSRPSRQGPEPLAPPLQPVRDLALQGCAPLASRGPASRQASLHAAGSLVADPGAWAPGPTPAWGSAGPEASLGFDSRSLQLDVSASLHAARRWAAQAGTSLQSGGGGLRATLSEPAADGRRWSGGPARAGEEEEGRGLLHSQRQGGAVSSSNLAPTIPRGGLSAFGPGAAPRLSRPLSAQQLSAPGAWRAREDAPSAPTQKRPREDGPGGEEDGEGGRGAPSPRASSGSCLPGAAARPGSRAEAGSRLGDPARQASQGLERGAVEWRTDSPRPASLGPEPANPFDPPGNPFEERLPGVLPQQRTLPPERVPCTSSASLPSPGVSRPVPSLRALLPGKEEAGGRLPGRLLGLEEDASGAVLGRSDSSLARSSQSLQLGFSHEMEEHVARARARQPPGKAPLDPGALAEAAAHLVRAGGAGGARGGSLLPLAGALAELGWDRAVRGGNQGPEVEPGARPSSELAAVLSTLLRGERSS